MPKWKDYKISLFISVFGLFMVLDGLIAHGLILFLFASAAFMKELKIRELRIKTNDRKKFYSQKNS